MKRRALIANLALLVASSLVALALAELAVRLLETHDLLPGERGTALFPKVAYSGKFRLSANRALDFDLDPEDPLINADGFRDRDFPVARSEAVRILMLGDSVTFGHGVPLEASFPKLLEAALNRQDPTGRGYEVLNFGLPGYNTRQELVFFEWKGRKYAPDLLVIGWVLNDCWPAGTLLNEYRRIQREQAESPTADAPPSASVLEAAGAAPSGLLARSRLVELVRDRVARATESRPRHWLPLEQICAVPENWSLVSRSFEEIARIAAEDRFEVAVVIFPMLVDFAHYPYRRLHQRVAQEAHRNGFAILDLLDTFTSHDADALRLLPADNTHPGAEGHRIAAEGIRTFLEQTGLLPTSRRQNEP